MKHTLNAFVASALFLASFTVALATSGACSGHGGVSCSAGEDSDGSVICEDGWRNSSVSYASMVKCGGYNTPAVESTYSAPVYVPVITPTSKPIEQPVVEKPIYAPTSTSKPADLPIVTNSKPNTTVKKTEVKSQPVQVKATTTLQEVKVIAPKAAANLPSAPASSYAPSSLENKFNIFLKFFTFIW